MEFASGSNKFIMHRKKNEIRAAIVVMMTYIKVEKNDFMALLKMFSILVFGVKIIDVFYKMKRFSKI